MKCPPDSYFELYVSIERYFGVVFAHPTHATFLLKKFAFSRFSNKLILGSLFEIEFSDTFLDELPQACPLLCDGVLRRVVDLTVD